MILSSNFHLTKADTGKFLENSTVLGQIIERVKGGVGGPSQEYLTEKLT